MLDTARQLLAAGLSVIPIPPPGPGRDGKTPALAWRTYQERRPTADEVQGWFDHGEPLNLAVITGAVSGIVVVDTDSPEAEAWAAANLPATPWMVRTSKGRHRYYRHPGTRVKNRARFGPEGLQVDLRGDGGYVVGPGSQHASGAVYVPEGDWSAPASSLPILPSHLVAGANGNGAGPHAPAPAPPPRRVATGDYGNVLARAREYVAAVPPAVQGQGGDAHTYRLACKLRRGFGLHEWDALQLLMEWNHGCAPPWSKHELEVKLRNAERYGEQPPGSLRDVELPPPAPPLKMGGRQLGKGVRGDMHPDHPDAEKEPPAGPSRAKGAPPERPWIEPAPAFLAGEDKPQVYLVEQLLPAEVLCLIHGEPRARKSWLALELAVALVTGTPVCGLSRFAVSAPVPVLYSSQEDARSRVRHRLRRFFAGRTVTPSPQLHLSVHADINLEDSEWQERLIGTSLALGLKAIILDPIRRYSPNVDKGPAEVRAVTGFLRRLSVEACLTVVIVHHDVKPPRDSKDERRRGHRASGGDWFAACEAPITVEKAGKDRALVVPEDYKFSQDPEPFAYEIVGRETDPTVHLQAETVSVEHAKLLEIEERVIGHLADHPMSSTAVLAKVAKVRKDGLKEILNRLSTAGRVDCVPGDRGAVLWFLAATDSASERVAS